MKVLLSTLIAGIALGTTLSANANSGNADHGAEKAPASASAPKSPMIDEKKSLVDLSKKQPNELKMSGPTHDANGKELKKIPMPSASAVNAKPAGASGLPMSTSYARPQLGLSPYYGNPKDAPVAHAPSHKAVKKHVVVHKAKSHGGGGGVQVASVERIDGQVRYLNQRQNELESDVKSVKVRQDQLESKYAIDRSYAIRNDQ